MLSPLLPHVQMIDPAAPLIMNLNSMHPNSKQAETHHSCLALFPTTITPSGGSLPSLKEKSIELALGCFVGTVLVLRGKRLATEHCMRFPLISAIIAVCLLYP